MRNLILLFLFLTLCSAELQEPENKTENASFYHDRFHGQETSNGEFYNKDDFTAAHKKLPFNTILIVTNKTNNKSVIVRVNDRGPFKKSRVVDLSRAAAKKIGMVPYGVVPVKINQMTFLDAIPMCDSLFNENDTWDCFGNKKSLSASVIYIWKTENWKHAFYMASSLSLEYKLNSMYVHVEGKNEKRKYAIYINDIDNEIVERALVKQLKDAGYCNAKIQSGPGLNAVK